MRAAALTGAVALSLTGCGGTVAGTPWPEGQGPPAPAAAAGADGGGSGGPAPTPEAAPPTSFTVPGPLSSDPPAPEPPQRSTTTVAPVPVAPGTGAGPGAGRARPVSPAPGGRVPAPVRAPAPAPLTADVLADECLLDTGALTALLGTAPAAPATNAEVRRPDGSRARSCFAVGGSASVAVNVYTTNLTTPQGYVRAAAGARPLGGTGDGTTAALLETVGGPTLQLAAGRHLVTVSVAGAAPDDPRWQRAARTAAAALAGR